MYCKQHDCKFTQLVLANKRKCKSL